MTKTIVIYRIADRSVLTVLPIVEGTTFTKDTILAGHHVNPEEYESFTIDGKFTKRSFMENYTDDGLSFVKISKVMRLKKSYMNTVILGYSKVCQGTDPVTGKDIYVDCTVNGTTYRMNAGRDAASTFDLGLNIAKQNNETTTFIVDFYNQVHADVPLADALEVNLIQGIDARVHYQTKQGYRTAINAATTVEEVQAVDITFPVNVE